MSPARLLIFSPNIFKLFFLICLIPLTAQSQEKVRNVIIFFSYGSNLPAFEKIITGLNSTISGASNEPVNIITEYLDISRIVNDDHSKAIINMYNEKLNEMVVDLLITVGPGVNDAIQKYGDSSLKSLNMINVDLDMPGRTSLRDLGVKNGKEIFLNFLPEKTMRHAFELFPDRKHVYIISGVSKLDIFYSSLIRQSKKEFEPAYNFKFVPEMSFDSTIRFVRTIPPNSIVLVPSYLQDATKVNFSTPEVMGIISQNSRAPVMLGITDGGFDDRGGGIGGYLFSYINLGKEIGRVANEIINGKKADQIPVNNNVYYQHIYDWKELKKWNLTESKLIPADSIFYNKEISFYELYKWQILGVILFMISQTLLIAYLFRLNKRQRAINVKIQVTERMHRKLEHSDRLSKMSILTASLSHELFQPLAAIRITAQAGKQFILADKLDNIRASQMFENILEDETRATKLIRSVKSLMKEEAVDKEKFNLNTLIDDTIDLIATEAEKENIKIKKVFKADHVYVFGNKIQIQQVLINFIRNSFTAMEKNDAERKILEIILKQAQDEVTVYVNDSGPGLDPSIKERLFMPFISTKKEGFGIGLALCKSLIENHHGKIWAENIPDSGALFAFSLPIIKHK